MATIDIDVHDVIAATEVTKAEIEVIVEKVAPDLQKDFPKVRLSKIKQILEGLLITKVADKGIEWVRDNLPEIVEKVREILSGIDSLGP